MRYLPTLFIVVIGLVWKSILGDLKRTAAWSAMSTVQDGLNAEDSVLLNYVNRLEILSVVSSLKRKHWAVFSALVSGLLLGTSVTVANSLTFTNLSANVSNNIRLRRTSGFAFDSSLAYPNGSLTIPLNHIGNQPYGAVSMQRILGDQYVPWTNGKFAFESFETAFTHESSKQNVILEAEVSAFSASFGCHEIKYSHQIYDDYPGSEATVNLFANASADTCFISIKQEPKFSFYGEDLSNDTGWLNVTSCLNQPDDIRIVATIATIRETKDMTNRTKLDISSSGLVCSSKYTTQRTVVRVDRETGKIVKFDVVPDTLVEMDISTSVTNIWQYLNNPTSDYAEAWRSYQKYGNWSFATEMEKIFSMANVYSGGADPFFELVFNSMDEEKRGYLTQNASLFKSEVETTASEIMVQIVHALARSNSSAELTGRAIWTEPRLLVRTRSLRLLQVMLSSIGVVGVLLNTRLRPKSYLDNNPGSLAATAITLASSESFVEERFSTQSRSSSKTMICALQSTRFKLHPKKLGVAIIPEIQALPVSPGSTKSTFGWMPLVFRVDMRAALVLAFVAAIISLGTLQYISQQHFGLSNNEKFTSELFSAIPTFILVLLSYACSGVDAAVHTTTSYKSLRGASKKQPLLLNLREFNFWTRSIPWSAKHNLGFTVVASSLTLVIFPIIKIFAAGLYTSSKTGYRRDISIALDTGLPESLEQLSIGFDPVNIASRFAEWMRNPTFNLRERPGTLDRLIFSDMTGLVDGFGNKIAPGDAVELRVPAILVDVNCTVLNHDISKAAVENISFELNTNYKYSGITLSPDPNNFQVFIVEMETVKSLVQNATHAHVPWSTIFDQSHLDVSAITVGAVTCSTGINMVEVNTNFTQPTGRGLGYAVTVLAWSPTQFDRRSMKPMREYQNPYPSSWSLLEQPFEGNSLWPSDSTSENIFELLATYAEYQAGNLSSLLGSEGLARATEEMYALYLVNLLAEYRAAAPPSVGNVNGTVIMQQERISQNLACTIIVEILLTLVLFCLLWIFLRFPRKPILPKDPDTIAARFSFLAGSRLVQRLREDPSVRQYDEPIWNEKAGLGWWPVRRSNGSFEKWRWGIDVGNDMVFGDWKHTPFNGDYESLCQEELEDGLDSHILQSLEDVTQSGPSSVENLYRRVNQPDDEESIG